METNKCKIDFSKINYYIEQNKKKKPPFVAVSDEQWAEALDGYQESMGEGLTDETTAEQYWSLIYFSAIAFCRGMEFAEVKAGTRTESYYPRY